MRRPFSDSRAHSHLGVTGSSRADPGQHPRHTGRRLHRRFRHPLLSGASQNTSRALVAVSLPTPSSPVVSQLKHQHRSNERHKKSPANAGLGVDIKWGSLDVLETSVVELRMLLGDSLFVLLVLLARSTSRTKRLSPRSILSSTTEVSSTSSDPHLISTPSPAFAGLFLCLSLDLCWCFS